MVLNFDTGLFGSAGLLKKESKTFSYTIADQSWIADVGNVVDGTGIDLDYTVNTDYVTYEPEFTPQLYRFTWVIMNMTGATVHYDEISVLKGANHICSDVAGSNINILNNQSLSRTHAVPLGTGGFEPGNDLTFRISDDKIGTAVGAGSFGYIRLKVEVVGEMTIE